MNPKALIRLLLETSGAADQNVTKLLARDTDSLMDAMRGGKVDDFLRGSTEGRALLNNPEFMRMTGKVSGNLDYITRSGADLAAGRSVNATEFLTKMDIPANGNVGTALTKSITDFNTIAARGASTTANNADAIAAARRTRAPSAPRDVSADEVAARLNNAKSGATQTAETAVKQADEAAPAAAKASVQAAADAPQLSYFAARRIANGNESLTSKIELLHRGGRDDLVDRVIAKARIGGEIDMDVARTIGRSDAIPDAVKTRITDIAASRADPGFLGINARIESVKASIDYARHFPLSSSLQLAKDSTLGTLSAIRKHPFMTAIGLGGAHYVTGGDSSRIIGDTANTAGRVVLGTTASVISAVATPETAQAVINTAEAGAGLAVDAARNSTGALATIAGRSVGVDVDPTNAGGEISSVLGRNPLGRAAIDTVNAATRVQNHGDGVAAPDATSGTALGNVVAGAKEGAANAAGRVAEGVENAADATALANAIRNPGAAWGQLREAAKTNPTIQKIVEVGDQHPFLKWGMVGGFALGALSNGSPMERVSMGIRNALIIGAVMDLVGAFIFRRPSAIFNMFNQMRNGPDAQAPATANTPTPSVAAQPNAAPTATPQAAPAVTPQAELKSTFAAQAAPVVAPVVDPTSTSFAFKNAAVQPDPTRQVVVAPAAPASNDPVYRRDMPVNPLMMSMGG